MPGGQWVAFDANTDNPHQHYKENTNYSNHSKWKKNETKFDDNITHKTNDSNQILKLINNSIKNKKILTIDYEKNDGTKTNRTIYPTRIINKYNKNYLEAYCTLRKDNRVFNIENIISINVHSKIFEDDFQQQTKIYENVNVPNNNSSKNSSINHETNYIKEIKKEEKKKATNSYWAWFLFILLFAILKACYDS